MSFPDHKISRYEDTKTGKTVLRGIRHEYAKNGELKTREVMEIPVKKEISTGYNEVQKELNTIPSATRIIEDFEHNTITELKISKPLAPDSSVNSMTTIYNDKNGKVAKRIDYTKSPVKGNFDITETDASGKTKVLAKSTVNKDGSYAIVRNYTSLDGTTTKYRFKSDKDGNHKAMFCQIKDKDGKVLSTIDRTYDKENRNLVYSSVNGNKFKAERKGSDITVTNLSSGEVTKMNSEKIKASDETMAKMTEIMDESKFSDENILDKLFDTMPADALLTINSNVKQIIPVEDDMDSMFMRAFDFLVCKTDDFTIMHELGHSKDSSRVPDDEPLSFDDSSVLKKYDMSLVAGQKDFYEAYTREKANFEKAFPEFHKQFVDYFINSPECEKDQGRNETVAESNAINGISPVENDVLSIRTAVLQQYFPRTIAEATKIMHNLATTNAGTKSQAE